MRRAARDNEIGVVGYGGPDGCAVANTSRISVGSTGGGIGSAGCGSAAMVSGGRGGIGGSGCGASGRDGVPVGDTSSDDFSNGGGCAGGRAGDGECIRPSWIFGRGARHCATEKRGENHVLKAPAILIVQ
ncbi:MAG TPA: hypothetical protein VIF61_08885 [Methylocystis sp.]